MNGEKSGSELVNRRLYGILASRRAASMGANESEPSKSGFETRRIFLFRLFSPVAKNCIVPLTWEKISCSKSDSTIFRLGASTNHY